MNNYSTAAAPVKSGLLSVLQLTKHTFEDLLALASDFRSTGMFEGALQGKNVVLIFEKPSLRTRIAFEVAIRQLGGWPVVLDSPESRLGERESIPDIARNLSLWVDGVVARVFSHQALEELSLYATVPVINALSDHEHPCQAVSDILTLSDVWRSFADKQLVYVGDWNNVARSLAHACGLAGLRFRAIGPEGFGPEKNEQVEWSTDIAAVRGADAIYTDVWASMGFEHELASRIESFRPYQVNERLLAKTGKRPLFMHCLPAHRGQEVVDLVIDSEDSLVFHQAANRLPVAKAILFSLLENSYEASEEGRAGVFRRLGHIDHHSVAQGKLWV